MNVYFEYKVCAIQYTCTINAAHGTASVCDAEYHVPFVGPLMNLMSRYQTPVDTTPLEMSRG